MKKYFFLLPIFLIYSFNSYCQVPSCADSVKTTYYYHADMNSTVYSVTVDTFDLDSGKITTCIRQGDSPATMGNLGCTQGYWSKVIISYNLSGETTELLTQTGSATGWKDSLRTVYTYDVNSGNLLSKSDQMWNGTSWVQTNLYTWTYDLSNMLTEEMEQYLQGGTAANLSRVMYFYTGNLLNMKIVQKGSGSSWINDKSFLIKYDVNGIRDSVMYRTWNNNLSTWNSYGYSPYYFNNRKVADFAVTKTVNISGNLYTDSTFFSIDTLENFIYFYEMTPTGPQSMGDFYNVTIQNFEYVNNKYLLLSSDNTDYFDDHSGSGLAWYCSYNNEYDYDSSAYLIQKMEGSHCVMPNDFYTNYLYDSNHILLRQTGHLDANIRYDDYTYNYYFGNTDSVVVYEDPFDTYNYNLCQGDILHPTFHALGGCGEYHFSWTPSVGLSSDTIPDPTIVVGDSTVYTLTVTDGNGLVATAQYYSYPRIQANIAIDTTACSGCPVSISTAYSPFYHYNWYFNDSLLQAEDSSVIFPTATGNYFVIVTSQFNDCPSSSDTIYYLIAKTSETFNDAIVSLHPNPTNGLSNLKIGTIKNQHISVRLYNISGENRSTLFEGNGKDLNLSIDSQKYSPGVYIISITTEKSRKLLRWVVTR